MFKILEKTWNAGTVTTAYPKEKDRPRPGFRGAPEFDWTKTRDISRAMDACPAGAIASDRPSVDYGRCIFCGECASASPGAVRMTSRFELAARSREELVAGPASSPVPARSVKDGIHRVLGRSLAIREVDSGSCNACEQEIIALNNPVYDIERFGVHFVASPRHADMLLVTGPVTRNMELALRKTYDAAPDPKLVVAAGACGISGGLFGENYATVGAVDRVVPVDVYIPGCPPRPEALLHGILLAVGRLG